MRVRLDVLAATVAKLSAGALQQLSGTRTPRMTPATCGA